MVGVVAAPEVLSCTRDKEESDPGQVDDCSLDFRPPLIVNIEGLEDGDGDWEKLVRRSILICVSRELSSQAKVKLPQLVVSKFSVPHGCKYFTNGTKVLFHGPLLDWDTAGCQKASARTLGEYL